MLSHRLLLSPICLSISGVQRSHHSRSSQRFALHSRQAAVQDSSVECARSPAQDPRQSAVRSAGNLPNAWHWQVPAITFDSLGVMKIELPDLQSRTNQAWLIPCYFNVFGDCWWTSTHNRPHDGCQDASVGEIAGVVCNGIKCHLAGLLHLPIVE